MRAFCILLLCACCGVGCVSIPFEPAPDTSIGSVPEQEVLDAFTRTRSPKLEAIQSVVFEFFGRKMTGLGALAVDRETGAFALSCMTPMGVKLFDIQGVGDRVDGVTAIPQFEQSERLGRAVGQDLIRTYMNQIPGPDAVVRRTKTTLVFTEPSVEGRTEYVFGGPDRMLVEKRIYRGRKRLARIRYFDYFSQDGYLYPRGIVLENREAHYRLILRLRKVYPLRQD
ncbi:MAG: DUF3261 domain-containing protein [Kiritimatiellia bacterium]|nr:DUF3261 domain-containing protein [Kiritimatiellia bacterium]